MRLWSIHPEYLDAKGLVALWREGLLAQKVLQGKTKGYKHHPQLIRFKDTDDPVGAIAHYLRAVVEEADRRGYNFDAEKIDPAHYIRLIPVTSGQMDYELQHLLSKLKIRDPKKHDQIKDVKKVRVHPSFEIVQGEVEAWEII
ncbi:MAG TPA: pyrimidine dimer DNA glycosylase/endonuclease V [Pontiella sp.]